MIAKVQHTVEHFRMLTPGAAVVAAVSGGADSMALLSILCALREDYTLELAAAHVNHGLRGAEAQRDEDFVREICAEWGVALRVLHADIAKTAQETGEGIEACGRRIRYEFFASVRPGARIATAHTLSDRAETMLFNLSRGAGLRGLCATPAVRGDIIRPLLDCSREEIEAYCAENGIAYVEDSSNADIRFARNRVRHLIVPQMKALNPAFEAAAARCLEALETDEAYLREATERVLAEAQTGKGCRADLLSAAHPALRRRVLAILIERATGLAADYRIILSLEKLLDCETSEKRAVEDAHPYREGVVGDGVLDVPLRKAERSSGKRIQIPGGIACLRNGLLTFPQKQPEIPPWRTELRPGLLETPGGTLAIREVHKNDLEKIQKIHKEFLASCVDYDKIIGKAFIRSRVAGDAIRLAGRGCTKSLKKLFQERGIPPEVRNGVAVLADEAGPLWLEGFGCAERCQVDAHTNRAWQITVHEQPLQTNGL